MTDRSPEPRPASTLILLRKCDTDPLQALMVVRQEAIAFAGGAIVFPGGRVDSGDHAHARVEDDDAFRIAAIRETFEECGILLAYDRSTDAMVSPDDARQLLERHRHAVAKGKLAFADMLQDAGLRAATDQLVPFARWITPPLRAKRFDTHFFVARYAEDQHVAHDEGEVTQAIWLAPTKLLADARDNKFKLVFATRLNVERLAAFASVDDAIEKVRNTPVVTVRPKSVETPEGRMVHIPLEAGYGGELFLSNDPASI
jgi:8-oxo-dGTP pyrophosphatase MutT (NUDIX family)